MARVLIVDDSMIMRRNLKMIFVAAGHTVVAEASNGKDAIAEYQQHQPDIVTMDITMPVMDGIESARTIVEEFPEARIVMISALDQRHMVFEALENGAKHYILKPFQGEHVLEVVEQVLKMD